MEPVYFFSCVAPYLCFLEIILNLNNRNRKCQMAKKPHYFFYCSFAVLWLMRKSKFLQNGKIPLPMKVIL